MSYNHTTEGHQGLEGFLRALELQGVKYIVEQLGGYPQVRFSVVPAGKRKPRNFVAEEFLAFIDEDCDGTSRVDFAVYEEGDRPENLVARDETVKEALQRKQQDFLDRFVGG